MSLRGDHPAYIREDLTNNDLEKLVVSKLQGNATVWGDSGWREYVMCDEIIGNYYSKSHGGYVATSCAQVIYSTGKGNIHIIPVMEYENGE